MKRCLLTGLVLLASADPAAALTGRVIDGRAGAPLAGVHVTIVGHPGTAVTDHDGRFTWLPDPRPPFVAMIVLGGGRLARPIYVESLSSNGGLTLTVSEGITEQVTVAGIAPHLDTAPGTSMTLVGSDVIGARSSATLAQALEEVPGVSATSDGQAAVPTVRGLARGRTLILIDGGRVVSERRAGPSASFLDPALIDSVVVVRGPASVAYGTDALGGVVAVRTRRPLDRAPLSIQFTGTVGAGIPERRGVLQAAKGFARGGVLAVAHQRDVDDYQAPDGTVGNSGWKDAGLFFRLEQQTGPGRLSVAAQHAEGLNLGRPRSDLASVRVFSPFERSARLSASYEIARLAGIDHLRIDAVAAGTHERSEQDRPPAGNRPRVVERATLSARDAQLRVRGGRGVRSASLEFGVDLSGRYSLGADEATLTYDRAGALASTREVVSIQSATRTIAGSFVQVQVPATTRVTLAGGLRLDSLRVANTGGYFGDRTRRDAAAAAFAAVSLAAAPGLSVTARLSRGFRDATLSDRFHRGLAGRGFVTGNPDLEPETSRQIDLTAVHTGRRFRVSASVYHYRITDLIEIYSPVPDHFTFRNRGRAQLHGGEIEAEADLSRGWSLALGASTSTGRAPDDGAALNDIAPATVSATLRGRIGGRLSLFARTGAIARDHQPGPSEVSAPGYLDVGAGAGVRVNRHLDVRLAARNLLNARYYASPGMRWVYAPGLNGTITATIRY
ncbi:MAG TPA: TonB-dependent receptor [Vicinamibacterales bacterium]|nr:TonB-dependent receptor [Vicinamibacterales bacterium]